ncbi:MAG: S8 family peptidase [Candidatus Nanoarchaeia archaeon]
MTEAKNTKNGIVILSEKPIQKQKKRLVSSEKKQKKTKNLEELLNSLSKDNTTSYVAESGKLYQVHKNSSLLEKAPYTIGEFLVQNYSPLKEQYIGVMKKNSGKVLEDNRLNNILAKASKSNLPERSRKKLIKKVDQLIDSYFSYNIFFKHSDQKRISKQAMKVPETTFTQRAFAPVTNLVKKSESTSIKKKVFQELEKLYFRNKRQDIILQLNSNNNTYKNDIGELLKKDLGAKEYFVFDTIPFIAVPCSVKDIDRVCYALNNRKNSFLKNTPAYASAIKNTQRSSGVYTPELFSRMAKEMGFAQPKEPGSNSPNWNLRNIHAPAAWHVTKGKGANVLILDTGVDYNHPELKHCFESNKGYNFVTPGKPPMDDNHHGTHCSGIVAGQDIGVAPECTLYAAKVLDSRGSGLITDIIRGINYGIKQENINIISMSLGSPSYSIALSYICKSAYQKGLILCGAAGNEGHGPEYPASCTGVISVAALNSENEHARFSNIHDTVDISAPGVDIYSAIPDHRYARFSGTSMATPHCAGAGALAVSVKNSVTGKEFEKTLKESARELGAGDPQQKEKYGAGLIQADCLVHKLYKKVF